MRGKRFHRLTFLSALALAATVAAVFASGAGAKTSYAWACDNQDNNGLTNSITITAPIVCSSATYGVLVGAPGITIKCTGNGSISDNSGGTYGVYTNGYDHISVIGCPITGFDYGIYAFGFSTPDPANGDVFKGNTIDFNDEYGIYCEYCHGALLASNTIIAEDADTTGIYLEDGSFNKVDPTTVNMNGLSDTYGVYLYEENGDLVSQTTVNQATEAGFEDDWSDDCGDGGGNTFKEDVSNGVNGSTDGFEVYDTSVTTFQSDYAQSGYDGWYTNHSCDEKPIQGHPTMQAGGVTVGPQAPSFFAGDGIVIIKASAAANNSEDGFYLYHDNYNNTGSVFSGNHSHGNGNVGFDAYGTADSTWNGNDGSYNNESGFFLGHPFEATVTNNTARFNNDSNGVFFPSGGFTFDTDGYNTHLVSHNTALNNNGWGFWAEDGYQPGGGNRAIGNSLGCFNVVCS